MKIFEIKYYGEEELKKDCLQRIIQSLYLASIPENHEDLYHRAKLLKKDIEELDEDDFFLIWRYADPFETDSDPHPQTNPYQSVHIHTIREISRVVVCRLANHVLENNPVWITYLAQERWKQAIDLLLKRINSGR